MADRILIRDLLARAILGVKPEERVHRQDVLVNVALEVDARPAAASDEIADTVNYASLAHDIVTLAEGTHYYLVEKLVSEIAWLCLDDRRVRRVSVTVEKPTAVRLARSVGVEISRTQEERQQHAFPVYIALGANLEPERNLLRAIERLSERCRVDRVSPVYESVPVDGSNQPCYLNAVARAVTALPQHELKEGVLRAIEAGLGRVRGADPFAARPIDLDLILYGDRVQSSGEVHVPAEEIVSHAHVAVPLADLDPSLRHPGRDEAMASIAERLRGAGLTRRDDVVLWPL